MTDSPTKLMWYTTEEALAVAEREEFMCPVTISLMLRGFGKGLVEFAASKRVCTTLAESLGSGDPIFGPLLLLLEDLKLLADDPHGHA